MVDFSKPINNADMVKALNVLVRCNLDLCRYYADDLGPRVKDHTCQQPINRLKALHSQHAELIGDTVRLLGGAPDVDEGEHHSVAGHWLRKLYGSEGVVEDMMRAEEKLQVQYLESLREQAVRASPECVAVINQVLEECRAAVDGLHRSLVEKGGRT